MGSRDDSQAVGLAIWKKNLYGESIGGEAHNSNPVGQIAPNRDLWGHSDHVSILYEANFLDHSSIRQPLL